MKTPKSYSHAWSTFVGLIKDTERLCSSYLWKGQAGNAVGAKVSWSLVCKPKSERGLGLKRVADWNTASLARLIWLLFSGSESLWIAWVKDSILKNDSFWSVQASSSSSWC